MIIPQSEFIDWMPHKPPMLWIDELLPAKNSSELGLCRVRLNEEGLYLDENLLLRPSSFIEFSAQAFGISSYFVKNIAKNDLRKLTRAYLVGVKSAILQADTQDLSYSALKPYLEISVKCVREIGPISLVDAKVYTSENKLIHSCGLRIYTEFDQGR